MFSKKARTRLESEVPFTRAPKTYNYLLFSERNLVLHVEVFIPFGRLVFEKKNAISTGITSRSKSTSSCGVKCRRAVVYNFSAHTFKRSRFAVKCHVQRKTENTARLPRQIFHRSRWYFIPLRSRLPSKLQAGIAGKLQRKGPTSCRGGVF